MNNQIITHVLTGCLMLGMASLLNNPPVTAQQDDTRQDIRVESQSRDRAPLVQLAQRQSTNELEGTWTITKGENPNNSEYTGTVDIEADGSLYNLSWNTGGITQSGIGIFQDGHLFVGWGREGAVYGMILYRINRDGTLDGQWTYDGASTGLGTERATGGPSGRRRLEGAYQITGSDPGGGGSYDGSLNIREVGDTYELSWSVDNATYRGVGIRSGDWLVVGWGPQDGFGVADYRINNDSDRATGRWALPGQPKLGEERLSRTQSREL